MDGGAMTKRVLLLMDHKENRRLLADWLATRYLFLPDLLVTARQDVGLVTRHLWKSIDEVIHSPIDKVELQARIEVLLRVRRQALALRQAGERALRQSEERLGLLIEGA